MAKLDIIGSLDIGTSKVACVIAEYSPRGDIEVTGFGVSPCQGLTNGSLTDANKTTLAIRSAVHKAELEAGYSVHRVVLNITGQHVQSLRARGLAAATTPNQPILDADIQRVLTAARMVGVPSNQEIVHLLPRYFSVDGQDGIRNPSGMRGLRLEVDCHAICARSSCLENLNKVVEDADLSPVYHGFVSNGVSSSLAALTEAEREVGVALIDIGAGTTDLTVYQQGEICHSACLCEAGDHFTHLLARHFCIPLQDAEQIKMEYSALDGEKEVFSAHDLSGESHVHITAEDLEHVLRDHLATWAKWVHNELQAANDGNTTIAQIVLTGGSSKLYGLMACLSETTRLPVRLGVPNYPRNLQSSLAIPENAVGIGNILYFVAENLDRNLTKSSREKTTQWGRFKRWISEVF